MAQDLTIRHVPLKMRNMLGELCRVIKTEAFPPGLHPDRCPLIAGCVAVRVTLNNGAQRWYGVERAWIDSYLRMAVQGFDARFEEMARWPKVRN